MSARAPEGGSGKSTGSPHAIDWSGLGVGHSVPGRLAHELTRMIHDGNILVGDKIPAERELADLVGVSRATVREALRELELRGLLDRRPGRGTVVVDAPRPDLDAGLLGNVDGARRALREVMDLRAVIEPPISERAAARSTEDELTLLTQVLAAGEAAAAAGDMARYVELDVDFHLTLARLTHNPLLVRLLQVTNEWMAPSRKSTVQSPQRIDVSLQAHRQILTRITHRDPDGAASAMREHLDQIQRLILPRSG